VTVGEWLRTRVPPPPPDLAERMDIVLGDALEEPVERASDLLLASGERLVAGLLRNNSTTRESALDLLAADALVTYAFELEESSPSNIEARAHAAMMRIASIDVGAR
jgi:hypothetical protein